MLMRSEEFWTYFNPLKAELGPRGPTFQIMFEHLDKLNRPVGIVETGCVRVPQTDKDWAGDGGSTLLFDSYAKHHPGSVVYTVDLNPQTTALCRSMTSERVKIHTGDSVPYLKFLADNPPADLPFIDLLYLDSYDVDFNNPIPSAVHHLKELVAINRYIHADTLIVVDDTPTDFTGFDYQGKFTLVGAPRVGGKGKFVAEYAKQIGATTVFTNYQCGWTKFR